MKCLNCGIEFLGTKRAKFHSPACKMAYSRRKVTVTENVTQRVTEDNSVTENVTIKTEATFTPNWKRLGFTDKETARLHVIATIAEAAKTSPSTLGFDGEATWIINGRTVILKRDGFKEIDPRLK